MYFQSTNDGMGQDKSFPKSGLRELPSVKCIGAGDSMTKKQVALLGSIGFLWHVVSSCS